MKHFDLFSGYGGFTLALERAYGANNNRLSSGEKQGEDGNKDIHGRISSELESAGRRNETMCIGFSEIDKYASAVLKYHWPNIKNYGDITKINWSEVPDFDLLTGGSPCQDLSIAGHRNGLRGERSGLFYEFIRAVKEKKPKYFIWENVKGALSSRNGWDFTAVINEMAEAGYSLWWQVLNAKDFGVPQNRERIFVVGFRDGSPREVFFEREDSPKNNVIPTITTRYYGGQANGAYIGDKENTIKQLNNPTHSNNRLYSEEGISPALNTAQGGNRQPKIYQTARGNNKGGEKEICPTISKSSFEHNNHLLKDSRIRRLTPTECERLMGLPDGWTKYGLFDGSKIQTDEEVIKPLGVKEISDSQRYKLCGNGVVVNVVEEIIKQLILV